MKQKTYTISKSKLFNVYEKEKDGESFFFDTTTNKEVNTNYEELKENTYLFLYAEFEEITGINIIDADNYYNEQLSTPSTHYRNAYGETWINYEAYIEFNNLPLSIEQIKRFKKKGWSIIKE